MTNPTDILYIYRAIHEIMKPHCSLMAEPPAVALLPALSVPLLFPRPSDT